MYRGRGQVLIMARSSLIIDMSCSIESNSSWNGALFVSYACSPAILMSEVPLYTLHHPHRSARCVSCG